MASRGADREHRLLLNRLTAIRLAQQILEQRTDLTPRQRKLVRAAIQACDDLAFQLSDRRRAEEALSLSGWPEELAFVSPAGPDRSAHRTEERVARRRGTSPIDALVIAPDSRDRVQLEGVLAGQGYVVRGFKRIDETVERLVAERRRLVVVSPDPDVGQAEIEAQVRALRSIGPRAAVLVCLDRDQAPRASDGEQAVILRRPFEARDLLARAAELYPAGPPRRLSSAGRR